MLLNLFLRHEPNTTLPSLRRVIQHIEHRKPIPMPRRQLVQLLLQQDIFKVNVRVDQTELRAVLGVLEGGADDLEHGRYAGSACDHAEGSRERGGVGELTFGTFDADGLADGEKGDVFGDVSLWVCLRKKGFTTSMKVRARYESDLTYLDEKVEVSKVVVTARRSVATHDLLSVNLSRDRNVLTNGKTEDILRMGESEPVAAQHTRE